MPHLEADVATHWADTATRLLKVARAGALYPDAAAVLQLIAFAVRVQPKKTVPEVALSAISGLPPAASLEKLHALRTVAADYLKAHNAGKPARGGPWSVSLAATQLPPLVATSARLVSKGKAGRRFLVVHDRWEGRTGVPVRFTFHLTDAGGRHLALDRSDQATVTKAFAAELEVACTEGAEAAHLHLGQLPGVAIGEVVMGQLGPIEAPRVLRGPQTPLTALLDRHQAAVLHLVLERAAADVAADSSRDPFVPVDASPAAVALRASRGFRVSRERRLFCLPAFHDLLEAELRSLGAALLIRSR